MSAARDALVELLSIYNAHNACTYAAEHGGTGIYITYRPQQTGRGYLNAAWQVVRPGFHTNPDGHWRDRGHKTFNVFRSTTREEQEKLAKEWASTRYGVTEWVKIPGLPYAWFPAQDRDIIKAALRAAKAVQS